MKNVVTYLKSKKGQGMVEYALIVLVVVAVGLAVFGLPGGTATGALGTALTDAFAKVSAEIAKV